MRHRGFIAVLSVVFIAGFVSSCSKNASGWSVVGEVTSESDCILSLEAFNNGHWYVIDSLKTHNGAFEYKSTDAAAYPEIMRLGLEGNYIYFPIDSVDRVCVLSNSNAFSTDYRLEGTVHAQTMRSLDSIINASVVNRGARETVSDATFKQQLFVRAFEDPSVMPLYYLINKRVGDTLLFDPSDPTDNRYYGAVAQRFATKCPDDPRGKTLLAIFKDGRSIKGPSTIDIEVTETGLFDIVRSDVKGKSHSLAKMASEGNVVLLSFTAYGLEGSNEYNMLLNSIYEKYKMKGLDIYQIAFDENEAIWKENARNIPWTAVWNSTTDGDEILIKYNVGILPMTFIIDRSGVIVERVSNPDQLESALTQRL